MQVTITSYENPEAFEKFNLISHVANWSQPMLTIHGGRDYRVLDTQGISAFTALQRRGIPSRMLYFPKENHSILNSLTREPFQLINRFFNESWWVIGYRLC
ncbi:unnamed protein product [Rotaria sp. Silwood1]|nr:unnamed protein product [Rotaria sp. Silwood1]